MGYRQPSSDHKEKRLSLSQQPFPGSTSWARSVAWRIPVQCSNLTGLRLYMSCTGNDGCSELISILAMSCPEDSLSELSPQSSSPPVDILSVHSLRFALCLGWGEVGIGDPFTAELTVIQKAGICKTGDCVIGSCPFWYPDFWCPACYLNYEEMSIE